MTRQQEYYQRNKEKILAKAKERYALKGEEIRAKNKEYALKNPEVIRASRKKWEENNPTWVMYHNAKRRATEQEIPFDITFDDIVIPDVCPVFHTEFSKTDHERRASLDRIVPSLGYVKGNVQVLSVRANRLKSDATIEELEALIEFLRAR